LKNFKIKVENNHQVIENKIGALYASLNNHNQASKKLFGKTKMFILSDFSHLKPQLLAKIKGM